VRLETVNSGDGFIAGAGITPLRAD